MALTGGFPLKVLCQGVLKMMDEADMAFRTKGFFETSPSNRIGGLIVIPDPRVLLL